LQQLFQHTPSAQPLLLLLLLCHVQVLYVSADELDTLTKLEKGTRAGSAAAVASFSCQGGCKRKKLLEYFGQKRWVSGSCGWVDRVMCGAGNVVKH
jgi:hypothetical protein